MPVEVIFEKLSDEVSISEIPPCAAQARPKKIHSPSSAIKTTCCRSIKNIFSVSSRARPDIIIAVDSHGIVNYYNDGARTSLGYSPEEIIGQNCTRIYPSLEEARRVMKAMRESADNGPDHQLRDGLPQQGGRDDPGHDLGLADPRR